VLATDETELCRDGWKEDDVSISCFISRFTIEELGKCWLGDETEDGFPPSPLPCVVLVAAVLLAASEEVASIVDNSEFFPGKLAEDLPLVSFTDGGCCLPTDGTDGTDISNKCSLLPYRSLPPIPWNF